MNTNVKYLLVMAGTGVVLACLAGPTIIINPPAPPVAPPVIVTAPAPAPPVVTVDVVPEIYVWDGDEYVGVVSGQYYYLGPGNVWVVMDADRLHRFNGWERAHTDWRDHAIRNEKYRQLDHPPVRHDHDDHPDHHNERDHNPPQ